MDNMIGHTLSVFMGFFALLLTSACSDSSNSRLTPEPLLERYELSSNDSVPEGVAFDPVERAFYATSLQGGSITRVDADGRETLFREADGRVSLVGTKVDAQERRLWVCARNVDDIDNRVWVFDIESGELQLEFLLGAISANGACNDLVLDGNGFAYVTDPINPLVYLLNPTNGEGEVFASDPLFTDITGLGAGLNGIAITAGGDSLVIAKFFPATLLRVSLPEPDEISPIELSGDGLPGPDGLVVLEGDVYAVSGDSISRIRLNGDSSAGQVHNVSSKSGTSTATIAESQLYVIKSEVVNFVLERPLDLPFEIFYVDTRAFED